MRSQVIERLAVAKADASTMLLIPGSMRRYWTGGRPGSGFRSWTPFNSAARHTAPAESVPSLASALVKWTGWNRWWQQWAILRTCATATLSNYLSRCSRQPLPVTKRGATETCGAPNRLFSSRAVWHNQIDHPPRAVGCRPIGASESWTTATRTTQGLSPRQWRRRRHRQAQRCAILRAIPPLVRTRKARGQ